jgi:hypothetical protein
MHRMLQGGANLAEIAHLSVPARFGKSNRILQLGKASL